MTPTILGQYTVIFCISILLSLSLILVFEKIFYTLKILDNPKKYQLKRKPVPYSMGIIFFISFFITSYFTIEYNYKLLLIWIFGFLITGISFLDDLIQISAKIRLIIQIAIGGIIGITSIKIGYISNIFGGIINLETYHFIIYEHIIYTIPLIFTILWYVFILNALNWTDGISGNTSGISIISFGILFLLGIILFNKDHYIEGQMNADFIMKMTTILVGILLPFWLFEIKGKILMGDSGTMFLGFMLATIAIIAGGKIATVGVVFGIYSVDAIYVVARRIYNQKNPLQGDFTHLHHRLRDIGLTNKQILGLIYSFSLFFGITALFLEKNGKIIIFCIIIVLVISINTIMSNILKKQTTLGK